MKSFFLGVPIFAFAAQVAFPAIVNDAEYGKIYELESFSVRSMGGEQTLHAGSAAVTVIGRSEIHQDAAVQLLINEALHTVSGVFALNPYNFAQDSRSRFVELDRERISNPQYAFDCGWDSRNAIRLAGWSRWNRSGIGR